MYYDDFELDCGCRMWCKCPKALYCSNCMETRVFKVSFGPDGFRCVKCGAKEHRGV